MAFQSDFTKLPEQILLDQINNDNFCALTSDLVEVGLPAPTTVDGEGNPPLRNTQITVTAKTGSNFTGGATITYNRVSMSVVPGVRSTLFILNDAVNISDLVPQINEQYGINLQPGDYVDGPLPAFVGYPNEVQPFMFTASSDAIVYQGSVQLNVIATGIQALSVTVSGKQLIIYDGTPVVVDESYNPANNPAPTP